MQANARKVSTGFAILACGLILTTGASASVMGNLDLSAGANTVTVTATSISWSGMFTVSGGTTLTYDSGTPLTAGSTGSLVDLTTATSYPVTDFMTFTGISGLGFNLSAIGPGSSNTNCAGATSIGDSCSVFTGSPFLLTLEANGTEVSLAANGTAHDSISSNSSWYGAFSEVITTLSGIPSGQIVTPGDIQSYFGGSTDASITSPYSGTFTAVLTPEPSTSAMMLLASCGLIAMSRVRIRRKRTQ